MDPLRWKISGEGIEWNVGCDSHLPHEDHIEMSGLKASFIVNYGVTVEGSLVLKRHVVWPMLRLIPNNTHGSFQVDILDEELPFFEVAGQRVAERPQTMRLDGVLSISSRSSVDGLEIHRDIFPTVGSRAAMERVTLVNRSGKTLSLKASDGRTPQLGRGCLGVYVVESRMDPLGEFSLAPGEGKVFSVAYSARVANEPYEILDAEAELLKRRARIAEIASPLVLETGVAEIDLAIRFAKIRAGESIFQTRGGLLHSPGGRNYYAATWCNDQVEYAGPWFAFTGDRIALEASLNAYRHYMPFMGPDYAHIPSSVIAEGFDIWEGRGDRGDAAMYAYGASRFALASGRREIALELWPGIEWTLEYCRRKLTPDGVAASDSDELEGRLPAGKTNLNTSSLYYGGLRSASLLAASLGLSEAQHLYSSQADNLAKAIETFFGHTLHGFKTYRYYEGNEVLRSWICTPLCMGLLERAKGTLDAMFSPHLWMADGMLSQEGDKIFWDRSTLYGFRGGLIAGATEPVFEKLLYYSSRRLLGDHVPYPIEAWPEGNQRHLSAESALYCRVITEGLFGIEPAGLRSFKIAPRLPKACKRMTLRNVRAFGSQFDIVVDSKTLCLERAGQTFWQGPSSETQLITL